MSADLPPPGPPEAPLPDTAAVVGGAFSSGPVGAASPADTGRARPSDEQVLRDIAAGNELALLELHRRYARFLYGLGGRMLASAEQVHQGVQDAMLTAWHHAAQYDPSRASVPGWLIGIAHHRFLQLQRESGAELALSEWFSRVDAPGDRDLQLLALAYYRGESRERLAEISGLSVAEIDLALRSAADQLASGVQVVGAPLPLRPPAELPAPFGLASLGPVTAVEPWDPSRRLSVPTSPPGLERLGGETPSPEGAEPAPLRAEPPPELPSAGPDSAQQAARALAQTGQTGAPPTPDSAGEQA